jgi:hypothetical protein
VVSREEIARQAVMTATVPGGMSLASSIWAVTVCV